MGTLMVAEGLGVTVLPDYSVVGDPLERSGLLTCRPIAGDETAVTLVLRHREAQLPGRLRDLRAALVEVARGRRTSPAAGGTVMEVVPSQTA